MTDVPLVLPITVLEQINKWADASGLSRTRFYSTALTLGARIMRSSVDSGFIDALTPEERKHLSESASTGVTPDALMQIVLGSNAQVNASNIEQATAGFVVSLPDDVFKQLNETADGVGMLREKSYSLALVTGARLVATTLGPGSIFPSE